MRDLIALILFCSLCVFQTYAQDNAATDRVFPDPTREYTSSELDSIFAIGRDYHFNGDYEKVVENVPAFIKYAEDHNEVMAANRFRSLLGNTLINLDKIDSADALFREGLRSAISREDYNEIVYAYINLGNIYLERDPDKAIEYLSSTFEYIESGKVDDLPYAIVYNNLAELYVLIERPAKAQQYLDVLISVLPSPELDSRRIELEFNVKHIQGSIYLLQQLYFRSIDSSVEALKILELGDDRIDQNYLIATYKNLIEAYDKTRQYVKLNEVRKPYDSLRDSRFEKDKIQQQKIATSRYDNERMEQDLLTSQYQNELAQQKSAQDRKLLWIFTLVGFILVISIGALLYTRAKRNKLLKDLKIKNAQYLEAKETSEKLTKKNTKFLSTISHELRTPLYGIIGLSSVFLNNKNLKEYDEEFNSLKFSADYLLSLVNDILNINKYESEKGRELKEEHFNLSDLIKSILQTFQFLNKKNNNEVHLNFDPKIPEVLYGDKTKLAQVIMNLMSNASKFTLDGSITLSLQEITNNGVISEIQFAIEDTGRGIEEANQKEIFEEFTQVSAKITEGGTGLGLPIVNKLLKILKSKLVMESTYGVGTTFSFLLPLKIGSKQKLESNINDKDIKKLDHKKLLIVDDNKINQLVTQKVLEQYHMTHDTVNDGQEAVDIVQSRTYDYILMDINMPVMNGIDATIKIRELGIKTPVIALTAADHLNLERDIYSHGIDAILVKPYHTEQLLALLIDYLK